MSGKQPDEKFNSYSEPRIQEFDPLGLKNNTFNDPQGAVPSRDLMFRMQDRMRVPPIQLTTANASVDLDGDMEEENGEIGP